MPFARMLRCFPLRTHRPGHSRRLPMSPCSHVRRSRCRTHPIACPRRKRCRNRVPAEAHPCCRPAFGRRAPSRRSCPPAGKCIPPPYRPNRPGNGRSKFGQAPYCRSLRCPGTLAAHPSGNWGGNTEVPAHRIALCLGCTHTPLGHPQSRDLHRSAPHRSVRWPCPSNRY